MKTITFEISDEYYSRFEYLAKRCRKSVNEYAKQSIENKTDAFATDGFAQYTE